MSLDHFCPADPLMLALLQAILLSFAFLGTSLTQSNRSEAQQEYANPDSILINAARLGNAGDLVYALSIGARLEAADANGATALLWAAYGGHTNAVRVLIDAGADIRPPGVIWADSTHEVSYGGILAIAAGRGHSRLLQYLIEDVGMPVDEREWNPSSDTLNGWTPIQWAAYMDRYSIVDTLLTLGADTAHIFRPESDRSRPVLYYLSPLMAGVLATQAGHWVIAYDKICGFDGIEIYNKSEAIILLQNQGYHWISDIFERRDSGGCGLLSVLSEAYSLGQRINRDIAQGVYDDLETMSLQEIDIYTNILGFQHQSTAGAFNDLGMALHIAGRYAEARENYERSRDILDNGRPGQNADIAIVMNNLAMLMSSNGDHEGARRTCLQAIQIQRRLLGAQHPSIAISMNNLSVILFEMGDYSGSIAYMNRAAQIIEHRWGNDSPAMAQAMINIANVYREIGRLDEARENYDSALDIQRRTLGQAHPDIASTLTNLASLLQMQGDYAEASQLLGHALSIRENALGASHPDVAQSLSHLAILEQIQGRASRHTRPIYDDIATLTDAHLTSLLPTLSRAEQHAFVTYRLPGFISLLLSENDEALYATVAGWKGLLIEGLHCRAALNRLRIDPVFASALESLESMEVELAHLFRRTHTADVEAWRSENERLTAEKEALERQLIAGLSRSGMSCALQGFSLQALRSALPTNSAFVDIYRHIRWSQDPEGEWHYSAVLSTAGRAPTFVDLGSADTVDSLMYAWRGSVQGRGQASPAALAEVLWRPLVDAIPAGVDRLWISPDGVLARLPWNWLAGEDAATVHLTVMHIPSARALLRLLTGGPVEEAPNALAVGDVAFGEGSVPFAPLEATAMEVNVVLKLAAQVDLRPIVLDRTAATPSSVRAALPEARYVHLATHGYYYREPARRPGSAVLASSQFGLGQRGGGASSPTGRLLGLELSTRSMLVENGLALAGANEGPEGRLTAEELVSVDLTSTRLLTLSACDTGRGIEVLGQGVMGLRAALLAAGARSLLLSLWKVPEGSTTLLMRWFYHGLWVQGLPPAAALRRAQDRVRADPRYTAPVYWAAWIIDGEG